MSLTLFETFRQIDPYVRFNDGMRITTAGNLLRAIDPSDPTEYVLGTDGLGRMLIYRLNIRGCVVSPPAYVEEKTETPRGMPASKLTDFGPMLHGFV